MDLVDDRIDQIIRCGSVYNTHVVDVDMTVCQSTECLGVSVSILALGHITHPEQT